MTESIFLRRGTMMPYSNIGNLPMLPGYNAGSNRSRRSSWSDSKVRHIHEKPCQLFV
jgi:hypothetical protein